MEDSGWYSVDKKHYENFTAGKGMGCEWFELCDNKKNDQYFPKTNGDHCNIDSTAYGYIKTSGFLANDSCGIVQPYSNANCSVDPNTGSSA